MPKAKQRKLGPPTPPTDPKLRRWVNMRREILIRRYRKDFNDRAAAAFAEREVTFEMRHGGPEFVRKFDSLRRSIAYQLRKELGTCEGAWILAGDEAVRQLLKAEEAKGK